MGTNCNNHDSSTVSDILFNNKAGTCITEIVAGGVLVRVRLVVTMHSVLMFWGGDGLLDVHGCK